MSKIVSKFQHEDSVAVIFNIESDEVMAIGEIMASMHDEAYMNGYNWEAYLNYYLKSNHPDLLEGLEGDPEAGCYVGIYNTDSESKADQLVAIINNLISNPEEIYSFLREKGEEIEWD